jgi:hypothetical protein
MGLLLRLWRRLWWWLRRGMRLRLRSRGRVLLLRLRLRLLRRRGVLLWWRSRRLRRVLLALLTALRMRRLRMMFWMWTLPGLSLPTRARAGLTLWLLLRTRLVLRRGRMPRFAPLFAVRLPRGLFTAGTRSWLRLRGTLLGMRPRLSFRRARLARRWRVRTAIWPKLPVGKLARPDRAGG